jgi:hypothetical protein
MLMMIPEPTMLCTKEGCTFSTSNWGRDIQPEFPIQSVPLPVVIHYTAALWIILATMFLEIEASHGNTVHKRRNP